MARTMSITERKDFQKLMTNRQNAINAALSGNMFGEKEDMVRSALTAEGFSETSEDMKYKIEEADAQLQSTIASFLEDAEEEINLAIKDEQEIIDQEIRNITEVYRTAKAVLEEKKEKIKEKKLGNYSSLEDKIAAEKAPERVAEIAKLKDLMGKIKIIELRTETEIKNKLNLIKKMKYRIENALRDKLNRVQEGLVLCDTREEAKKLLEEIPTLTDMFEMCVNYDGINGFIQKMTPKLALPAPEVTAMKETEKNSTENMIKEITIEAKQVNYKPEEEVGEEVEMVTVEHGN